MKLYVADENDQGNQNGAMLMLAEVAAWTLTADKTKTPAASTSTPRKKVTPLIREDISVLVLFFCIIMYNLLLVFCQPLIF